MGLRRLQVTDFRCLQAVELELDSRFTLVSGVNGSGKTSLLEAIYLLGRGRSFRTRRAARLIRAGADHFVIFGELEHGTSRLPLGIEGSAEGLRARIGGKDARSVVELALHFPVQIIDPEVHKLIEEGPGHRRRFLDWGVFHVEPRFIGYWQRYRQALSQRNAALKSGQRDELVRIWNVELIQMGVEIAEARQRYLRSFTPFASESTLRLLGLELELAYRPGWSQEFSFEDALRRSESLDRQRGATQVGPHRAELLIRMDGSLARDRISRGQQKLVAAALLIAQLRCFPATAALRPTLLLDDPAAELDSAHLQRLIDEVRLVETQLVVTTLDENFPAFGKPGARFRIDQGLVSRH